MRHKIKTNRLGRFSSLRKATIKSLVSSVLINRTIVTTKAKAKAARPALEKIITLGKDNTLAAKRRAFSFLCDHNLVKYLFGQIAPKFKEINGGYSRIIPYKNRKGDNAELVVFELTQDYKEKKHRKEIKEQKEAKSKKQETEVAKIKEEKPVQAELKPEELKKAEEKSKEEKVIEPHAHPEEEKKKKLEVRKPGKFLKGFKGFFKKERDSL